MLRALRRARLRWLVAWLVSDSGHRASLIASPLAPSGCTARNAISSRALRSPPPISWPAAVICSGPSMVSWTGRAVPGAAASPSAILAPAAGAGVAAGGAGAGGASAARAGPDGAAITGAGR